MDTIMPQVRKLPGETWRDAVARVGEYVGKAWEALRLYDNFVAVGKSAREAASMVVHDYNSTEWALV